MSYSFNQLTAAQAERLALLLEELGEAQQAIGKILRHGYNSHNPNDGVRNRFSLERELGDVRHCIERLCDAGDISEVAIHNESEAKGKRVEQYLHHQSANDFSDRK
jgi:hypothetical protein